VAAIQTIISNEGYFIGGPSQRGKYRQCDKHS
jgi:hypothetical protein